MPEYEQVNGKSIREPYLNFCKYMEDANCHVLVLGGLGSGMNLVKECYVREHNINYFNFQNKEITHEDVIHLSKLKNTVSLLDGVDLHSAKKGKVLNELLSLLRVSRRWQNRFILTARVIATPDWTNQMGLILAFERLDKGEGCAVLPIIHK